MRRIGIGGDCAEGGGGGGKQRVQNPRMSSIPSRFAYLSKLIKSHADILLFRRLKQKNMHIYTHTDTRTRTHTKCFAFLIFIE